MKINRRQLRKLIVEVLKMGQVLDLSRAKKGMPIVRGDKGTGDFHEVTGELIALSKTGKFVDGGLVIGLLYRGLLYGLVGTDAGPYNLSIKDIEETKKLNEEYKTYYGTGDSIEYKPANMSCVSKDLYARFKPFYNDVVKTAKMKNKVLFKEVFGFQAAIKLGEELIENGVKPINKETILQNNREYRKRISG